MAINRIQKLTKGMSVIEILVAIFVLMVAFTGIAGLLAFSLKISNLNKETVRANFLAQEAVEAVRNIRDSDWTKLTNGNHGLTNASGYWDFTGTENIINGFTRIILIEDVNRDSDNDNIVLSGGTLDSSTKKVKVTVSWRDQRVEITTYLTDWK